MTASAHRPIAPSHHDLRRWGLDPAWSRTLPVVSHDGSIRHWHLLDAAPPAPEATVLCVHGNPTWAYTWKPFLEKLSDTYRVVAVDQLGMGYSEEAGPRRFADRVLDLGDIIGHLEIDEEIPLILAGHDWGGAVAMGWAVDHPERVGAMILCNTGIAVPNGRSAPRIIRLAAASPLRDLVCRRTPAFVEGALRLSGRRITRTDRQAFRAPYRSATARAAIADFVGDIPLRSPHPSERDLDLVAERLSRIEAPVLLAWGSGDPVFDDSFADDLAARLPNTSLQRFATAGHLVTAEADVAGAADVWLSDLLGGCLFADHSAPAQHPSTAGCPRPLWAEIERRREDPAVAFVDVSTATSISFAELARRVEAVTADLHRRGLRPGDRVAILTPPSVDAVAVAFGVLRAGGVALVADRGLGLIPLGKAFRSGRATWAVGPRLALCAAWALRWVRDAQLLEVTDLVSAAPGPLPDEPDPDDAGAILFTSGATGPPKGVRYTHRQLAEQRDALASAFTITSHDRLVAAFAPFSLYGPALGLPTAIPDTDVTKPGLLTAVALDRACVAVNATIVFASPSALANVVATSGGHRAWDGLSRLRKVLSAGAPVPVETLRSMQRLAPDAGLHTPYGMTEVLPVADIDLVGIEAALRDEPRGGVCVGTPVNGAEVMIASLGFDARHEPSRVEPTATGEILIRSPWTSEGYLELWLTERMARPRSVAGAWHRSGDVGHLDPSGRLWVEGRTVHVVSTADGPVTPIPVERTIHRELGIPRSAVVGVGPTGCQQVVVVLEIDGADPGLAHPSTAARVRSAVDVPLAAVLVVGRIPVDIRHNAKVDRTSLSTWANSFLAGRRSRPPR